MHFNFLSWFNFLDPHYFHPSKHVAFTQCWFNVGLSSSTLAQHWNSIGWMSRVCWEHNNICRNLYLLQYFSVKPKRSICLLVKWADTAFCLWTPAAGSSSSISDMIVCPISYPVTGSDRNGRLLWMRSVQFCLEATPSLDLQKVGCLLGRHKFREGCQTMWFHAGPALKTLMKSVNTYFHKARLQA